MQCYLHIAVNPQPVVVTHVREDPLTDSSTALLFPTSLTCLQLNKAPSDGCQPRCSFPSSELCFTGSATGIRCWGGLELWCWFLPCVLSPDEGSQLLQPRCGRNRVMESELLSTRVWLCRWRSEKADSLHKKVEGEVLSRLTLAALERSSLSVAKVIFKAHNLCYSVSLKLWVGKNVSLFEDEIKVTSQKPGAISH